jgi:hypothetical protein
MGSYGNLAWLILLGGIATIAAFALKADEALARMVAGVTGFLPWAGLLYGLSKLGTDLFQILSIGAYLTLLAGLVLFGVALFVDSQTVHTREADATKEQAAQPSATRVGEFAELSEPHWTRKVLALREQFMTAGYELLYDEDAWVVTNSTKTARYRTEEELQMAANRVSCGHAL